MVVVVVVVVVVVESRSWSRAGLRRQDRRRQAVALGLAQALPGLSGHRSIGPGGGEQAQPEQTGDAVGLLFGAVPSADAGRWWGWRRCAR